MIKDLIIILVLLSIPFYIGSCCGRKQVRKEVQKVLHKEGINKHLAHLEDKILKLEEK